jgi:hypothetical protein
MPRSSRARTPANSASAELIDRAGIIAASVPDARRPAAGRLEAPTALRARRAARRSQVLGLCAAALLLIFVFSGDPGRYSGDVRPLEASGALPEQAALPSAPQPRPTPSTTPATTPAPGVKPQPVVTPPRTAAPRTAAPRKPARTRTAKPRLDAPVEAARPSAAEPAKQQFDQQIQQVVDAMAPLAAHGYGRGRTYGYGR